MAVNIEIKARLRDFDAAVLAAERLSDSPREVLEQEDVFFNIAAGRLKLRILAPNLGELIYYERPDAEGPKASVYDIARTPDPDSLRRVLSAGLGVRGIVRKTRWLYLAGPTRIHLDRVEGLGAFLELEVVMEEGQAPEIGVAVAEGLMVELGVRPDDLVEGAYMDLLESNAG